ncbi:aldehyde dehydrogenase family protein [Acinetobacter baumannii]|uniref:aldehyde dehydrogenase family protein n=1 Tax=Acinetobacter baumannii TaxID=470 RepID=UPI0024496517|nr:aldehyde dehydrogenase family protein [Acinetobacter baumannii]MDH2566681.1 aldehyde dehydrogenase family protein [Acinetobacter baumannii]
MDTLTKELDTNINIEIDEIVNQSFTSQKSLEKKSDNEIDLLITEISKKFADNLKFWAEEEIKYTGIGNVTDKIHKLNLVTDRVYRELYGRKTYGRLSTDSPFIEFASPVGVIFGIVPLTNPVPNSLFKILLSLKTRNSLILSFPRKAEELGEKVVKNIQQILKNHQLPIEIIQAIKSPSRNITHAVMSSNKVALILATGGSELVKAAYRSGTPAIGVGPGNVPVFVSATADLQQAAESIIEGKTYDNGIVCGSESNIIVDEEIYDKFIDIFESFGGLIIDQEHQLQHVVDQLFDESTGHLKREIIGINASQLLEYLSIDKPQGSIKLLVLKAHPTKFTFLNKEKMAPILTLHKAPKGQGIDLATELLWQQGAGHTAVIHSHDQKEINDFAEKLSAGRILINMPATHGMLGIYSDLPLSFMQGSGSWGGNISTDPVNWRHLVNIKRVCFRK